MFTLTRESYKNWIVGPSASAFSGKKSERSIETSEWKPPWIFLIFLNDTVIIHPPSNIRFQFSVDRFVANQKA